MRQKYLYNIFAASLTLLAVSCEKSDATTAEGALGGADEIFVTITIDPIDTRVGVDGMVTDWSAGDVMRLYNASATMANNNMVTAATPEASGSVTFSGTLQSTLVGGQVEGIYPGANIGSGPIMNNGNTPLNSMATVRVIQPSYFKYEYDANAEVVPSSLGEYCYLHFISNETLSGTGAAANLTGTVKHLMSYLTFNLTNVKSSSKVERVYIKADNPLTNEGINLTAGGAIEYDQYLDYIGMTLSLTADGAGAAGESAYGYKRLGGFDFDYFVFELTGADSNLGVAVADGELTLRMPIIPQTLSGAWDIFVVYADGTESIASITHSGSVAMTAGKSYNDEERIALTDNAAAATAKVGDFYFEDGSYKTNLTGAEDGTESNPYPVGVVYGLKGNGADTKMDKVFHLYFRKDVHTASDYCNANASSNIYRRNSSLTTTDFTTTNTVVDGQGQINTMETLSILMNGTTTGSDLSTPILTTLTTAGKATYIKDILEEVSPALYNILMFNEGGKHNDVVESTLTNAPEYLDGSLRDFWYMPSIDEQYEMIVSVLALSSHNDYYFNNRMVTLPSALTGTASALGGASTADNSFSDGTYFNLFVAYTGQSYIFRNSSMTAGSIWGLKSRPLQYFSPSSSDYICHVAWGVVNNEQPSRAILIVDNGDE